MIAYVTYDTETLRPADTLLNFKIVRASVELTGPTPCFPDAGKVCCVNRIGVISLSVQTNALICKCSANYRSGHPLGHSRVEV